MIHRLEVYLNFLCFSNVLLSACYSGERNGLFCDKQFGAFPDCTEPGSLYIYLSPM